jgi:preprotein translocase subunit SecF
MNAIILGGDPSITGSFTQESSKTLADQLKYGALPLSFTVESSNSISADLGSQQLADRRHRRPHRPGARGDLLADRLPRASGSSSSPSLAVMAVLTYLTLCILAWRMGFRLSLAGVAGLIVTIGFTADSFIVYFERIRDELRDGKSITGAVEDGWGRAKRTIYISKSINILAAVVLYILADATVKGFAFTLGLTTAIDVLIFILFTHPVLQLLARTKFFGSGIRCPDSTRRARRRLPRPRAVPRAGRSATTAAAGASAKSRGEAARARRSPSASRRNCAERARHTANPARPQGGRRLMRTMSQVGNDLYTGKTSFPFVGRRRLWFLIAALLVIGSALVPLFRPIQFSIEFTGGSQFTVSGVSETDQLIATDAVHSVVPDATTKVVTVGADTVRVQTDQMTDAETREVTAALAEAYAVPTDQVSASFIGPSWGEDVTRQSLWGLAIFLALTFIILALYFRTWKMSVSAIIGLVDVLVITIGVYALFGFEISPAAVIGFLTILSYALYDTTVVFDKIRENTSEDGEVSGRTFGESVNLAVNQTLIRSINTTVVAVLPTGAILFIGWSGSARRR